MFYCHGFRVDVLLLRGFGLVQCPTCDRRLDATLTPNPSTPARTRCTNSEHGIAKSAAASLAAARTIAKFHEPWPVELAARFGFGVLELRSCVVAALDEYKADYPEHTTPTPEAPG